MTSATLNILAADKLNGNNYASWKNTINTVLIIDDLRFVLVEECPQVPAANAIRTVREAYERRAKANEKARAYILASLSKVLAKKHESMLTAREIMDSLQEMFGQASYQIKHDALKYIYNARMNEGASVREHVLNMMVHFNVAEMNGAVIDEAIRKKAKAAKGICFHCNQEGHWKRNCPKYLAEKKKAKQGATNHVCSSFLGISSWRQLEAGEMTMIERLVKNGLLSGLEENSLPICESCLEGKMTKRPFTGKGHRAKEPLELVHSDLCDPMNVKARGGFEYFITFTDDYSRYVYVYLMQHKSEALEKFKEYKAEVENALSKTIKTFRLNRGEEYMDLKFQNYLMECGIVSQLLAPVQTAVYILNCVPSKSIYETPLKLWNGRKGYPKGTTGGYFYDPKDNKVFVSTNATFLEEDHIREHKPRSKIVLNELSNETTEPSTRVVEEPSALTRVFHVGSSTRTHQPQSLREPQRSGTNPLTFKKAMEDVDKDEWIKAMNLELESMYFNSVWDLVDQPDGVKPIGCKWIYKRKRGADGDHLYATTRRIHNPGQEQKICKLNLSIYGLKQASRSWNIRFDTAIKSYGFDQSVDEPCVYKRIINNLIAFLVLYVDYILLTGNDIGLLTDIKQWLAAQFQMKDLGEAQFVLGIQIFKDRKNKTLALSQASYIDKIVVKYSMQNSKRGLLPFRHGVTLSKEQCLKTPQEVEKMRHIPYASAVGSLMYAMLCTRPDICYAVGIVSRYQSNPGLAHWTVVKTILKYLRRTRDYMLVYGYKDLILTRYTDSDFQTDRDSRKSTSGSVFTLNGGAVVWRSIKQGCIADSTMEAEYVAACEAAKEAV
ncbi:gag/pol protein [Cucumis melo var. makuwa]|uniref:Gag/pol protein n=1 Tax=Cucumis melo var. makuwa TaxID=1194695 RepID=A0A5A7UXG8_CUCMM|nr:gag/pol protein [Cucumis melo var. makuwa]